MIRPEDISPASTSGRIAVPLRWDAPDVVTTKLLIKDGLPHVKMSVNGHEKFFILDTGSEHCVFEADLAHACGIRIFDLSHHPVKVRGVAGSESALVGLPDRMEIGSWRWHGSPCLVRTVRNEVEGGGTRRHRVALNILGLDVIRMMCSWVTIDYPRGVVQFGFRSSFKPSASLNWSTPITWNGRLPYLRPGNGENRWSAMLDTGASTMLEFSEADARRLGLDRQVSKVTVARVGIGDSGFAPEFQRLILPRLTGLGPEIRRPDALIVEDRSKIGTGLLQRFRTTIDFRRNLLWLEDPGR